MQKLSNALPDPTMKAPPLIQTKTGILTFEVYDSGIAISETYTLSKRQSSTPTLAFERRSY